MKLLAVREFKAIISISLFSLFKEGIFYLAATFNRIYIVFLN